MPAEAVEIDEVYVSVLSDKISERSGSVLPIGSIDNHDTLPPEDPGAACASAIISSVVPTQ